MIQGRNLNKHLCLPYLQYQPSRHLFAQIQQWKSSKNVENVYKVINKDTGMTSFLLTLNRF